MISIGISQSQAPISQNCNCMCGRKNTLKFIVKDPCDEVGDVSVYTADDEGGTVILISAVTVSNIATIPFMELLKCSHCSCMAGLGEACSQVVTLSFAAETHTNCFYKDESSTSQLCAWLPPNMQMVNFFSYL